MQLWLFCGVFWSPDKEPEEKLDPNTKPAASSGIRRLYVVDYTTTNNNFNVVELVVIFKLDIECNSLSDKVAFANLAIQDPIPTKPIANNEKLKADKERLSRNESYETSERNSHTSSLKFSLIVLCFCNSGCARSHGGYTML